LQPSVSASAVHIFLMFAYYEFSITLCYLGHVPPKDGEGAAVFYLEDLVKEYVCQSTIYRRA